MTEHERRGKDKRTHNPEEQKRIIQELRDSLKKEREEKIKYDKQL